MSSFVDTPVVTCASCRVDVPLVFPARARTVVCNACGTQLDLDGPQPQVIASVSLDAHRPEGLIETGRVGRFGKLAAQVVGRTRMASSEGVRAPRWEDWIVATEDGRVVWIREEDGHYSLLTPFEPSAPVPDDHRNRASIGTTVPFDGMGARVEARLRAKVVHVEGELPVRVCVTDLVSIVELQTPSGPVISVRTYEDDLYFRMDSMEERAIWEIFGYSEMVAAHDALYYHRDQARERGRAFRNTAAVLFSSSFLAGVLILTLYLMSGQVADGWSRFDFQPKDGVLEQDLGGAMLHGGVGFYTLTLQCRLSGSSNILDVFFVEGDAERHIARCRQTTMLDGGGQAEINFRVTEPTQLRLVARHQSRPEQSGDSVVSWTLDRHVGSAWWPMGGVALLLFLGGASLIAWPITDGWGSKAVQEEYENRRALLKLAMNRRNRVPEVEL